MCFPNFNTFNLPNDSRCYLFLLQCYLTNLPQIQWYKITTISLGIQESIQSTGRTFYVCNIWTSVKAAQYLGAEGAETGGSFPEMVSSFTHWAPWQGWLVGLKAGHSQDCDPEYSHQASAWCRHRGSWISNWATQWSREEGGKCIALCDWCGKTPGVTCIIVS